ncbi:conserved exported hypothetical protein [Flavobacterium sp. 9AF]|uniref:DUF6340 family protein n=1 Tax=Flavobacterium sp. 9AF TaxID=2653142 RepID=UPI0012F00714|nr:DUF6340 family protein [Flavobacterium sp. 9AF]VXC00465.1 conserved exported hypothetical protein [Flavobacterium sp. 9AF]
MQKNYFFLTCSFFILILFTSCSATNVLTLSVTEPAPVLLHKASKNIGILNRSIPDKKYEIVDAIDKILTAEGKELDKKGSENTIESLQQELQKNEKLNRIIVLDTMASKKYGMDQFSAALPWSTVEAICIANDIDVIYELSFYDTDSKINYTTATSEVKNAFGLKVPILEHIVTVNTLIKSGWRIYDNHYKAIVDEYATTNTVTLNGRGINPVKAFETITTRKEAVLAISKEIGQKYAWQLLLYSIRVSRDYYVKGTNNFEIAKRRAQAGQWDGAAELWLLETQNTDSKIAGRACYNMGISNEINGDLDKAIAWTTKSYTDYGDKNALRYLNILKNRKAKQEQLERENN